MTKNCGVCHLDSDDGGIDYIGDLKRLILRKKVIPGDLDGSRIWQRITDADDPMPPEGEEPRPSDREQQQIRQWILSVTSEKLSSAKKEDQLTSKVATEEKRTPVNTNDLVAKIHDHLSLLDEQDRRYQRYFVLNHLHNLPSKSSKNKGVSSSFLNLLRAATSKTLNSLSWSPGLVLPQPIDPEKTILSIDVRDIEWDSNKTSGRPDLWNILVQDYPYGLKHDQYPDTATSQRNSKEIYQWLSLIHI